MNKFSELVAQVQKDLDVHCQSTVDRALVASYLIGTVLSRRLDLPSSRIDAPNNYFTENLYPVVNYVLSRIGEDVVINAQEARRFVHNLWRLRYMTAYPSGFEQISPTYGYFDTYMGVSAVISAQVHEFVNKYKDCLHQCSLNAQFLVNFCLEEQNGQ